MANAPEYQYNVRPLGFLSMRCDACSATPPMLDNQSYQLIWQHWQQQLALVMGNYCPDCGSQAVKRFGHSSNGKARFRCKTCGKTYSVRNSVMKGQQQLVSQIDEQLDKPLDKPMDKQIAKPIELCRNQQQESELRADEGQNGDLTQLAAQYGVHFDRACEQLKRRAWQTLWSQPAADNMASVVFTLGYKGRDNNLWGILTTDMQSGKILHLSTTLLPLALPTLGRYQSCIDAPPLVVESTDSAIDLAHKQEQRFLHRQQFDRCDFGQGKLSKSSQSHALPVLTAHAHFALLKALHHGEQGGAHVLAHEVFLRGACITQYAQQVKNQQMALVYVVGETAGETQASVRLLTTRLLTTRLLTTRKLGWWQNIWQEYGDESGATKAYSVLCGKTEMRADEISLLSATKALRYIEQHSQRLNLDQMTASRLESLLLALAANYNQAL
ncbi:IS1 family transposase [Vibrio ponticus]|uniref:IS1 family transposase n=1 Tax=Vibrio ponticus TaxID=265668 RepID=UPI001115303C|nr:IS1 family transposase [Vibrio ponticus]